MCANIAPGPSKIGTVYGSVLDTSVFQIFHSDNYIRISSFVRELVDQTFLSDSECLKGYY